LDDVDMVVRRVRASVWDRARTAALSYPEAYEDFPWGESVVKVRKKIFVFLGSSDVTPASTIGLKLSSSVDHARSLPGAEPMGYGLGRHGWTHVPLDTGTAEELIADWIEESYRLIAPKTLVRQLDE
jgi:predicted DNA-binding protein (MmcQ/YjbR family)